jgi:hypothetical protein
MEYRTSNTRRWILRFTIFAITFLAFSRLTTCDFVFWDDQATIQDNPHLNPPSWNTIWFYWTTASEEKTMGLYVPVTYTVWTGLAALSHRSHCTAPNPVLFHTANVLLHSTTAVLVFELLMYLFDAAVPGALGALLFALHPVQVETVGWASGTKDLLCGMFSVASLLIYVRSMKANSRWQYYLGLVLFVLAILSKPTAVVVPLMAAVISTLLLKRSIWKTIYSLWPWIVLMIPFLILTQQVQPPAWHSPLPQWASVFVAADALAFYACKLVWPYHLTTDYSRTPQMVLASHQIYFTWVLPALCFVVLLWIRRRVRPAIAASLLFVLPLFPVLGFVQFDFQQYSTTADHYLYLPMLGPAVLMTWALIHFQNVRSIGLSWPAGAVLVIFAVMSIHQERIWKNTQSLFSYDLKLNPHSLRDTTGLGFLAGQQASELKRDGKTNQARELFDQSIAYYQQALSINPDLIGPMYNIAVNYRETGRRALGMAMVHRIIDTQPCLPKADQADPVTIAQLLEDFDDIPGEIDWLNKAQQRDPHNPRIAQRITNIRIRNNLRSRAAP